MKIILSCTTTYERRDLFYYGIQSLLKQSLTPDLFLVNISKKSFFKEAGKPELPSWLQRKEITINDVEDIGPYTKLIPALDYADTDDLIITVDDDILYGEMLVEKLVNIYHEEPDSIICGRARRIKKNFFNNWKNYSHWDNINEYDKDKRILPLGVGGVLYQKRLLDLSFITNRKFLELAPTTDDLWFKMASWRKGVPVAVYPDVDLNNVQLQHSKGLQEVNFDKKYSKSIFGSVLRLVIKQIYDYLGINRTKNDFSWDRICKFNDIKI